MRRVGRIKKPLLQMKSFLKRNPNINEALRIFDISYDQYQKAMNNTFFYNSASTSSSVNTSKNKS